MTLCDRCGFTVDGPLHADANTCVEPAPCKVCGRPTLARSGLCGPYCATVAHGD